MLSVPLELETALAGGFGQGFHPAVITICATIKYDRFNASCFRPFGDKLAYFRRSILIGTRLQLAPHIFFEA